MCLMKSHDKINLFNDKLDLFSQKLDGCIVKQSPFTRLQTKVKVWKIKQKIKRIKSEQFVKIENGILDTISDIVDVFNK